MDLSGKSQSPQELGHAKPQQASTSQGSPGITRVYFIVADEVDWDYTPGRNLTGLPHTEASEAGSAGGIQHRIYHKAIYREYTDGAFKTIKARSPQWEHLGLLGPLIRAEVGDSIRVVFRNNTHLTTTMHAHGVRYAKDAEGATYNDNSSDSDKADDAVRPGGTYLHSEGFRAQRPRTHGW